MMNLLISLLVFALIFGGALAGMAVRPLLWEHHLHSDSKDVVKLTAGLIGTLTALVLGLLIASAKTTFDQKTNQVRQLTATFILLDDLLTQYGPEATSLRKLLRQSIPPMADRIWHEQANPTGKPARFESSVEAWAFYDELERLSPNNDTQRSLQSRAIAAFTEGAQMRLQLFTQAGKSIPTPFSGNYGILVERDLCERHPVCAGEHGRHDLAVCMRAVVCRRDLSGFGAG